MIITLNTNTKLDLPSKRVLEAAIQNDVQEVVVLGYDDSGELYIASAKSDAPNIMWMLEQAKAAVMKAVT